jgi:hypothetical protein
MKVVKQLQIIVRCYVKTVIGLNLENSSNGTRIIMHLTKTDYLEYTHCRKNLWLKKHKPELFDGVELSDFEKKIIEEGNIADTEARHLFDGGVFVDSHGMDAVKDTAQYIEAGTKVIFQATFQEDVFYIRADVLVKNDELGGYELYEVKASNDIKRKEPTHYIKDLGFQKIVTEQSGIKIVKTGVIHMNREFKRSGKVNYHDLFVTEDVSTEVNEMEEDVQKQMEEMKQYLGMEEEKGCLCIYQGRSNQCTTFAHSNPKVPEYSVHNINRIGGSKKLLEDWIDRGIYAIEDIDNPENLKGAKKMQYDAYMTGKVLIDHNKIKEVLGELTYPLQFFDFEGYTSVIPLANGFGAYEQIPFQYSLHTVHEDGTMEHKEFLITESSGDMTKALVERMHTDLDTNGSVIVWYKTYEKQRIEKLIEVHPKYAEFLETINDNIFDLMEIFSKQYYVDAKFMGSASIKKVLPVLVPELTYKSLNIQKGDQASERWEYMISDRITPEEKEAIKNDLLTYCKLDTLAMVRIWEFLRNIQ